MLEPTNKKPYVEAKQDIYAKHPKHSAYRSGLLVQEYKKARGDLLRRQIQGVFGALV